MQLPKRISPCPIIDAIVELRFESKISASVIFSRIYNEIDSEFPKVDTLPVMNIPENIRKSDPNLRYQPHYKLIGEKYIVQIGPEMISFSCSPEYAGWENFSKTIYNLIKSLHKEKIVDNVTRFGFRYVNFFPMLDVFENIEFNMKLNQKDFTPKNSLIRAEIESENYISTLQISNSAVKNNVKGSIIDIDVIPIFDLKNFFNDSISIVEGAHNTEKELFFKLLKPEFLRTLNPEY